MIGLAIGLFVGMVLGGVLALMVVGSLIKPF